MRKVLAVAAVAAVLLLPGCAWKRVPGAEPKAVPAPRIGIDVPVVDPKTPDVVRVRTPVDGNINDTWETTKVASFAEAKRLFPQAMLPKETLGRRLVGIVYRGTEAKNVDPKQQLVLLYEDGLTVGVSRNPNGGPHYPETGTSIESTDVAGVSAKAKLYTPPTSGAPVSAVVEWRIGVLHWGVCGDGLTKADVVKVARSLAP